MNPIDWNAALESVNSDRGLLLEVIAILQQEIPKLHAAMLQAVEDKNELGLRQTAHQLKGSVRFLGPNAVHSIAEQIEMADAKSMHRVGKRLTDLSAAIDRLALELKAFVNATDDGT